MKAVVTYAIVITTVVFNTLISIFSHAQLKQVNSLHASELKGKVQSCVYYWYKAGEQISHEWNSKNKAIYNKQGNLVDFIIYNNRAGNDSIAMQAVYVYDKTGEQLQAIQTTGKSELITVNHTKNSKGNKVENRFRDSKLLLRTVYNKRGKPDSVYKYDISGNVNERVVYRYYKNTNNYDELVYRDGKLNYTKVKKVNKDKNVITEFHIRPDGLRQSRIDYQYNGQSNLTMKIDSNSYYVGGYGISWKQNNKDVRVYTYKSIDNAGNWLQQSMIDRKGKTIYTVKRKISYY
jgi:hypothetical protein